MKELLEKLLEGRDLTRAETIDAFDRIMNGKALPTQIAAFLTALRSKGEVVEEITGAAQSMRLHAVYIDPGGRPVIDTCGTGGDASGTFNISTAAAIVAAGAGVFVAKHGNRAVTSGCGSADVLQELGVNIDVAPEIVEECLHEIGLGFLFAPKLHPAMKYAAPVRRDLGIRTLFNILGPLTNPAGARRQLIGVFAPQLTEALALVLCELGGQRALVVHGHDGLDEISNVAPTRVSDLCEGHVRTYEFDPQPYLESHPCAEALKGGDPVRNAAIIASILGKQKGPCRDIVCLNAAAAIMVSGAAADFGEGIRMARESLDSGAAADKLQALIERTG